ncbi:MAG: energy transducer TonB [bacterium]|nr:energy transducer TonB [bacterium]
MFLSDSESPEAGGVEVLVLSSSESQLLSEGGKEKLRPAQTATRQQQLVKGSPGRGAGEEAGSNFLLGQIRRKIAEAQQYPPMAKRLGQEGKVVVQFSIGPQGEVSKLTLLNSSTIALLDEEALASVQRGAPYPLYEKPVEIGIRFSLHPHH